MAKEKMNQQPLTIHQIWNLYISLFVRLIGCQKKRLPPRMQGDDVQLGGRWLDGPQAYIPEGRRFDQKHHEILQENHGKPPYLIDKSMI